MSSQVIYVDKSPSFSTTSGHDLSSDSSSMLVQQLRANVFDVGLFQSIEYNYVAEYDIKTLLKQVSCEKRSEHKIKERVC